MSEFIFWLIVIVISIGTLFAMSPIMGMLGIIGLILITNNIEIT